MLRFDAGADVGQWSLRLCNDGEADAPLPSSITVRCASEPLGADGVGGFALEETKNSPQELVFTPCIQYDGETTRTLPAGASLVFGWVRLATVGGTIAPAVAPSPTGSMILGNQ